jgi:hypothetical protein
MKHEYIFGWGAHRLLSFAMCAFFLASCVRVPRVPKVLASDGSPENIQSLHDTQAADGDTITIPAGTFAWSSYLIITKAITLQGQTIRNNDGTSADNTKVQDSIPRSLNKQLIYFNGSGGQRLSGVTFFGGLTTEASNAAIEINGTTPVRLDHCVFDHVYFNNMISVKAFNFGVIDHVTFRNSTVSNKNVIMGRMGVGDGSLGDTWWTQPAGWGGPNFCFIEDCLVDATMNFEVGSKFVVRHCTFTKGYIATHGIAQTVPSWRSPRAEELYNNVFHLITGTQELAGVNGGGLYVHDNTIYATNGTSPLPVNRIGLQYYRSFYSYGTPFFGADGANPWDLNDSQGLYDSGTISSAQASALVDSTKSWATNQYAGFQVRRVPDGACAYISGNTNNTLNIVQWKSQNWTAGDSYQIYRCLRALDQPGLGRQVGVMNRSSPMWMAQADEPCYGWNNLDGNLRTAVSLKATPSSPTIIEGRDFINGVPAGYTPYTYPHPLVSGGPVPSPSPVPTPSPSASAIPPPTATPPPPSPTPTPTPTPTSTTTPTPSPTPSATGTPTSTPTPTPAPTAAPTASQTPTPAVLPPAPSSLVAAPGNPKRSIAINWQNNGPADSIDVERSEDSTNFAALVTLAGDATEFTDRDLVSGKMYWYRVKARNPASSSAYSNAAGAPAK